MIFLEERKLLIILAIVVIAVIALFAFAVFFLAARFGFFEGGFFPQAESPARMLIIGTPSKYTMEVLSSNRELVYPITVRTAEAMSRNSEQQLKEYDIVMLDQSQQANKEVSRALGEALQKYVNSGGKLITVLDSGIKEPNEFGSIGWKTTFGTIIPVECRLESTTNQPGCMEKVTFNGRIFPSAYGKKHRIMQGIEQYPTEQAKLIRETVLDITNTGNEIAYIEDARTKIQYTAISEAPTIVGKSIYFNYDPGTTQAILEATLKYLK